MPCPWRPSRPLCAAADESLAELVACCATIPKGTVNTAAIASKRMWFMVFLLCVCANPAFTEASRVSADSDGSPNWDPCSLDWPHYRHSSGEIERSLG